MTAWIVLFLTMWSIGATDGRHTGDSVPFWQQACSENRRNACARLLQIQSVYCADGSGWACNEAGLQHAEGQVEGTIPEVAENFFGRACELRLRSGCANLLQPDAGARENPRLFDFRLLLREGKHNLHDMPEDALMMRACEHGWNFTCGQ